MRLKTAPTRPGELETEPTRPGGNIESREREKTTEKGGRGGVKMRTMESRSFPGVVR